MEAAPAQHGSPGQAKSVIPVPTRPGPARCRQLPVPPAEYHHPWQSAGRTCAPEHPSVGHQARVCMPLPESQAADLGRRHT